MRVLTWNIRAGGGVRIPRIAAALAAQEADVLVLTEYRDGPSGPPLREALASLGYRWMTAHRPPPGRNGVLIASRRPRREHGPVDPSLPEPWRLLRTSIGRIQLFGAYMPNLRAKIPYWEALIASLSSHGEASAMAIGDFNTCRAFVDEPGTFDVTARFMDIVQEAGFRDLWRDRYPDGREFSWYSHRGNGFRIDHAFVSPRLIRRVDTIGYVHDVRLDGLSDHSMLRLDLR